MNTNNSSLTPPGYLVRELFAALEIEPPVSGRRTRELPPPAERPSATLQIIKGGRNTTLASKAGSLRNAGMSQEEIEVALLAINAQQCTPPLADEEVRGIARSIASYAPGSSNDVLRTLNDAGNARRFAEQWSEDVRYVTELGWITWSGTHWRLDSCGAVVELAKQTASDIYREGDQLPDPELRKQITRHSNASQQLARISAMLELAKSIPSIVLAMEDLDADPMLLGVANGTLDLRKGCLIPARREDYITTASPVPFDAHAACPAFLRFLHEITDGNEDLVGYLQRVFGYTLTGNTSEQCLFFLYGTGANGKSTLLNLIKGLLGAQLCRQTPPETIAAGVKRSGASPELACLKGARAVLTTEVDEGTFLSEALIKVMTGDDYMSARHLYKPVFDFQPSFKLFISGNHLLVIRGTDGGIWRRPHMVPFAVTIPPEQRDRKLAETLRAELPGILTWAVQGCVAWQKDGLQPPAIIVDAGADYREEMDLLGLWLSDSCDVGPGLTCYGGSAYASYTIWADHSGLKAWSNPVFGRKLKERFAHKRTLSGVQYEGFEPRGVRPTIARAQPDGLSGM